MLKTTGLVLGGLAVPGVLESCLTSTSSTPSGSIKIGFVSPITGPASGFGEPDAYVISLARNALKSGLSIGGTNYSVEIVSRDGQSSFGRVRGCGRSVHFNGCALGGVVPGPRRQTRPAFAVQVHVPLLLRGRTVLPRIHAPLDAADDQQEGCRDVAQRCGRKCDPRSTRASAQERRLHDRRPGTVRGWDQRLHSA